MIRLGTYGSQVGLDRLQAALEPPSRIGGYFLAGQVARTETALVYVARGPLFGTDEGVLKLTSRDHAPLLERELGMLVRCAEAKLDGIIRPTSPVALELPPRPATGQSAVALALPFCSGGNLVSIIGDRRADGLGSEFALEVGLKVGRVLRGLLRLPQPLVHGDVRPENVLLPSPDANLAQLTLIDFDAARELAAPLPGVLSDPQSASALVRDVRGFGELLFQAATGWESADQPSIATGNSAFDAVVIKCLMSTPQFAESYVCMADDALWRDLYDALAVRSRGPIARANRRPWWRRIVRP